MKKDKQELYPHFSDQINFLEKSSNMARKKFFTKLMDNHRIPAAIAYNSANNIDNFEDLDVEKLVSIIETANSVYGEVPNEILNNKYMINLNEWFTDVEIKRGRDFVEDIRRNRGLPVSIPAVQINPSTYVGSIDIKTLVDLKEQGDLIYDYSIQREADYSRNENITIPTPKVNTASVKEMADLLLQHELIPSEIVFNVRRWDDGREDDIIYNNENGELQIRKGAEVAILDGYHRLRASLYALLKDPDLEFKFGLKILYNTIEEAKEYQAQLNKSNPFSTERVKELSTNTNYTSKLLDNIMKQSELKGKVAIKGRPKKNLGQVTNFNFLFDSLEEYYDPKNNLDIKKQSDFLIDLFDYIFALEIVTTEDNSSLLYAIIGVSHEYYNDKQVVDEELVEEIVTKAREIDEEAKRTLSVNSTIEKTIDNVIRKSVS